MNQPRDAPHNGSASQQNGHAGFVVIFADRADAFMSSQSGQ